MRRTDFQWFVVDSLSWEEPIRSWETAWIDLGGEGGSPLAYVGLLEAGPKGLLKTIRKEADERWMKSWLCRYLAVAMKLCSPHACGRTDPVRWAARGLPRTVRDLLRFGARGPGREKAWFWTPAPT
jgi:hypothetical protein